MRASWTKEARSTALWAAVIAAGLAQGCGSSRSDSAATASSGSSSGGVGGSSTAADSVASEQASMDSSTTRAQGAQPAQYQVNSVPRTPTGVDSVTSAGGTAQPPGNEPQTMLSRDDQIAQWQSRLAASEQQFLASAGVCRDVCRATDSICHASRELCALTGDREGAPPTDPRCARARASCERAARQRQESCTSCPSE
jgi:hypothetical protein